MILQSLLSFLAGMVVSFVFVALKLTPPAPPSIEAAMGVIGLTVGYLIAKQFF